MYLHMLMNVTVYWFVKLAGPITDEEYVELASIANTSAQAEFLLLSFDQEAGGIGLRITLF